MRSQKLKWNEFHSNDNMFMQMKNLIDIVKKLPWSNREASFLIQQEKRNVIRISRKT